MKKEEDFKTQVYLGISGVCSHDSAASIIVNGEVIAAVEEERLIREKHTGKFPINSIVFCLETAKKTYDQVDCVAYFMNPSIRIIPAFIFNLKALIPRIKSPKSFLQNIKRTIHVEYEIWHGYFITKKYVKHNFKKAKFIVVNHHDAHAASAFFTSPFKEGLVATVDLIGEWESICLYKGIDGHLNKIKSIYFPDSLGKFYQTFTKYLGFESNSDEYKVMGLAAYGQETYLPYFDNLYKLLPDGSFKLNRDSLLFCQGLRPEWGKDIINHLGLPRKKEETIEQRHKDIAFALQKSTEKILLHILGFFLAQEKCKNLCLAGGVALNALANQKIRESGLIDELFIQPASSDAGTALGAALFSYYRDHPGAKNVYLQDYYLGPKYDDDEVRTTIKSYKFEEIIETNTISRVVDLLIAGKIIGILNGRMEFGPRALGNRSIIADPRNPKMKDIINAKIKFREPFRPFAPAILEERVSEYFVTVKQSPFMTQTFAATALGEKNIPATVHHDGTSRIQTVSRTSNPLFYEIIEKFDIQTGVPVVINTSFNVAGEPIVCSPQDAMRTFFNSGIDAVLFKNILLIK